MIGLHAIKSTPVLNLTPNQMFAIGEYIMGEHDMNAIRIRIGVRETTVQYHTWWGWDTYHGDIWRYDARARATRTRRGEQAIAAERIPITFTAQARLRQ